MKTLYVISGMTGMTGNELARQIIRRGDDIIGFDNFFASSEETIDDIRSNNRLHFFRGDINDEQQMKELEKNVASKKKIYDRVVYINCAAVVHTEHFYHVDRTFDTNVTGMKSFLEQAVRVGADTYINCSTSEVYSMESWKEGGMKESDYLLLATSEHSQRTSYATGKLLTEFFMKDAVDRGLIKGCSLRFANVYSRNELLAKHIVPHIISSLMKDGTVTLLENSKVNKRTFLHNIDSCAAVLAVIDSPQALDGTVYNVATQEEVSILELVDLCAEALGIERPKVIFSGYRASDPERRVLSSRKLQERTGWKPLVTLAEGIRMCVEYKKEKKDDNMCVAIITMAGGSSRFNEGQEKKALKGIYFEESPRETLLYSILRKCSGCKKVVLVGGYQYENLNEYVDTYRNEFPFEIEMVYNSLYERYGSGYSLWKGLERCFSHREFSDIIFIEGDLYFDSESFEQIKKSELSCITYNYQPILSNKAVIAYMDKMERIRYAFNVTHGLLQIAEPFSMIINSGQIWKFADQDRVGQLLSEMKEEEWQGTNLVFIEKYFEGISKEKIGFFGLKEWENCNTREDYRKNKNKL